MPPRFSIVTPVYDTPVTVLEATLRSVTEQTFSDWEMLLIDDCSPSPHVLRMLDEAAAEDGRIRVIRRAGRMRGSRRAARWITVWTWASRDPSSTRHSSQSPNTCAVTDRSIASRTSAGVS